MFFKKRVEIRKNEMLEMIKALLPTNATVVSFDYNEKVFGNIVLKLEIGKDTHTFITDRGEIYHNGKMLCNSSYHYTEKRGYISQIATADKAGIEVIISDTFCSQLPLFRHLLSRLRQIKTNFCLPDKSSFFSSFWAFLRQNHAKLRKIT